MAEIKSGKSPRQKFAAAIWNQAGITSSGVIGFVSRAKQAHAHGENVTRAIVQDAIVIVFLTLIPCLILAAFAAGGIIQMGLATIFLLAALLLGTLLVSWFPISRKHRIGICAFQAFLILVVWGFIYSHYVPPTSPEEIARLGAQEYAELTAKQNGTPEISWEYPALTDQQTEAIVRDVKASGLKATVTTYCGNTYCTKLRDSLSAAFVKAGISGPTIPVRWPETSPHPRYAAFEGLVSPYSSPSSDKLAQILKKDASITISGGERIANEGTTVNINIIFGWKPVHLPVSAALLKDMQDTGNQMVGISAELTNFNSDRQAIFNTTLQPGSFRDAHGVLDVPRITAARSQFQQDTSRLYSERYGSRISAIVQHLDQMGIMLPFHLITAADFETGTMAKWMGTIGTLLKEGKLEEARTAGPNSSLWFFQR